MRELVSDVIMNRLPLENDSEINFTHPFWVIIMGIEHEKIHLETTTCLIRQLPLRVIVTKNEKSIFFTRELKAGRSLEEAEKIPTNFVTIPETQVKLGRSHTGFSKNGDPAYYGWDNEFGTHEAIAKEHKVSDKLVSNAQFLKFVREGGYEKQEFWTSEGWNWASGQADKHPKFWVKNEKGNFGLRLTLSEIKDLPWDWPVEINCFEASAYCRWLSTKVG